MAPGGQQAVNTALSLTFRAAFAVLVACVRLPVRVCTKAATAVAALVAAIGAALEKVAGCWRCWSPQCCSVLCRVVVLACVCFAPQCRLHTYCPHSDRSGLWCSLGMCAPAAGVVFCGFCCLCGHCKVVTGCSICRSLFPLPQPQKGLCKPCQQRPCFFTRVLCWQRFEVPITGLTHLCVDVLCLDTAQPHPGHWLVRSFPSSFFEVGACDSLLVNPAAPLLSCGSLRRSRLFTV